MTSFIKKEIFLGWKHEKKYFIIMLIVGIVGIICIGIASRLGKQTDKQVKDYKAVYEEFQFYIIMDNFVGDNALILDDDSNKQKFAEFLNLMNNSKYFNYYMMYEQSVYIENYHGNEKNIYGYEYNADLSGKTSEIPDKNGNIQICTDVKGFWIGDDVLDAFKLSLSSGKGFDKQDYIYNPDKEISVILGAEYREDYKLGDIIHVNFVFSDAQAKVIGFLNEGSNVYYNGKYLNLDRYVIMPVFTNDDYNGKKIYNFSVNHFYTLRNSGLVMTKLSIEDVENIVKDYSAKAGLEDAYYVTEHDTTEKDNFNTSIDMINFLLIVIVLLSIIITLTCMIICIINRFNKKRRYYAILMMNGCRKKEILNIIICDIMGILMISYIIAFIILNIIFKGNYSGMNYLNLLCYGIIYALIPVMLSIILFFKCDLIRELKEEIRYVED